MKHCLIAFKISELQFLPCWQGNNFQRRWDCFIGSGLWRAVWSWRSGAGALLPEPQPGGRGSVCARGPLPPPCVDSGAQPLLKVAAGQGVSEVLGAKHLHTAPCKPLKLGFTQKKRLDLILSPPAAAKSPQSCPTLCDPVDGSPPGSAVPGSLQARTLEWVAISFSNA